MLKIGMYVRCPVDNETDNIDEARTFFLGQVASIDKDSNKATVVFHDPFKLRSFFTSLPEQITYNIKHLNRTTALDDSFVFFKGVKIKLLCVSKHADKDYVFNNYFVEYFKNGRSKINEVCETNIQIPFTRANYNPANQMIKYEFQNPTWYLNRKIISSSLNMIANAPTGFKNLLGIRVSLYNHQVDTVVRALSEEPCRILLADEAGLGKTVESIAILKGLMDKYSSIKSLIIVPDTIVHQWRNELYTKAFLDASIWGVDTVDKLISTKILLVTVSDFEQNFTKIYSLNSWDVCIVDETNKLLNNEDIYNNVLKLCKVSKNVLLLSATPILNRQEEYFKLLKLLNPTKYKNMSTDDFNVLSSKQINIIDIVSDLMKNFNCYNQDDFITGLNKINNTLKDTNLKEFIDKLSDDKWLDTVKLALAYIAEFYRIERGIICHRKAELENYNIKRELKTITYQMLGDKEGFYEEDCYKAVLDCAKTFSLDFAKQFINAMLSSPYAIIEFINKNKKDILNYDQISMLANDWKNDVDDEILNIKDACNNIDISHSKFSKLVDYIDQEDISTKTKYIIFTSFTSTAIELEKCFKNFFGENSTSSFYISKTYEEKEDASSLFQNQPDCRFMICDDSCGEGRNFQIADYIVHFDLPWSPEILEHRINKLDRIGIVSEKSVVSIVVFSENSLENDLFNIYDRGLNIFNSSLSGMEIAFEDINNIINFNSSISEINELTQKINTDIQKERYFDLARQLNINSNSLTSYFANNEDEKLMKTIVSWPRFAGFSGISIKDFFNDNSKVALIDTSFISPKAMAKSLYFPPKMDELVKRSKYQKDIMGTFSRISAISHENLEFFSPYSPLFDSITTNAEECYRGRCVAFKYNQCNFDWQGLVQIWNIKFNPYLIYKKSMPPELISLINAYLPDRQVVYLKPISKKYDNINFDEVISELDQHSHIKPIHLGKRDNGAIDIFKKSLPPDKWKEYLRKAYNLGKNYTIEQSKSLIKTDEAKKQLENILTSNDLRENFYGFKDNILLKSTEEYEALIYGLENPIIHLDSIAFMILEKQLD